MSAEERQELAIKLKAELNEFKQREHLYLDKRTEL